MIATKIIKDWFTGVDGKTYDPARMLWIAGVVAFLCFTAHSVYNSHKEFDMANFAMGYGALLAAGAAGVKIKESTEPKSLSQQRRDNVKPDTDTDTDDASLKPPKD